MKALILGGCGFIGTHIVDTLLMGGDAVRVFSRTPEKRRKPLPSVDYRIADFSDGVQLDAALDGMDVVIHALHSGNPGTANDHPAMDVQSNLVPTVKLLELMRKRGMRRMVFLSSGGTVYGNPQHYPVSEDTPLHPISSYGTVKIAIESYLFMYRQLYGFQPIILRPSNPYGPGQEGAVGAITCFMRNILHDKPLLIWGDGENIRDYFPVADLARLCALAARSPVCGIFNAGSGKGYSLADVIAMISSASGKRPEIQYRPSRAFDVRSIVLDCSQAESTFGWTAGTDLMQGIKEYWKWILESES